jgi:hypothetical protein
MRPMFAARSVRRPIRPADRRYLSRNLRKARPLSNKGYAVLTGGSSGIGAVYAERPPSAPSISFSLPVEWTDLRRLPIVSNRRRGAGSRRSSLTWRTRLISRIEALLRDDDRVTMLVNNAGVPRPVHCSSPMSTR